jgi:hypothetical protein
MNEWALAHSFIINGNSYGYTDEYDDLWASVLGYITAEIFNRIVDNHRRQGSC